MEFISVLIYLAEKSLLSGLATLGIALVFNVSRRVLLTIFLLGVGGGFVKFSTLLLFDNIILSSLLGSLFLGFSALALDKTVKSTPFALCIPPLICMLPGVFAYDALLGVIQFATQGDVDNHTLLSEIAYNLLMAFSILFALVIGVVAATMRTRRNLSGKPKS